MDVAHTAIWVSDLDETTTFYEDVLGLEYRREFTMPDGTGNYYVGTDAGAELQFKYDTNGEGDAVSPSGIDHLALTVDDVDATFERVVGASDCEVVLEPTTIDEADRRVAFVTDPDGYTVEFVQQVPK
ncbi:VOC family protein [Natronorubrum halophilum]|uniref:VOC family protein n=1 Tax=Natronorubrum halophilum TaxID=1702106 RepID=UPI0010C1BA21|nr:VOC family protein [Natronorubrum halophilum]